MFIKFINDLHTRKTVPKPTEVNSIYADSEKNPLGKAMYFITALTSPKRPVHSSWKTLVGRLLGALALLTFLLPTPGLALPEVRRPLQQPPNPQVDCWPTSGSDLLGPRLSIWIEVPARVLLRGFEHERQIQNVRETSKVGEEKCPAKPECATHPSEME